MTGGLDFAALARETLDLLGRWTAIASTADNRAGLRAMAAELRDWLADALGAHVLTEPFAVDPPIIHALVDRGAETTLVLYNMYDVMPAEPTGWLIDPFVGGVVLLPDIGPAFISRGAENNKGPLAGMLAVVRALLAQGTLPANLEILIEGEEESGSTALRRYLAQDPCPVEPAKAVLFPSFCEYGGGSPRVYLGFKGIARGEIRVEAGTWGGPQAAIHSSNAPWIANPAWRMVRALALLGHGNTGAVEAVVLDAAARAQVSALARDFDMAAELRFRHAADYAIDGTAAERLSTVLTTSAVNIAWLGTNPPAAPAVTPSAAAAGFDLRTPPGVDPMTIVKGWRRSLDEASLEGVEVAVADAYPGARFAVDTPGVGELLEVYRRAGTEPQIWPWAIGSAPAAAFTAVAPAFLIGGLGRGGNAHGVNEFITLDGLDRYLRSVADWITLFSETP